ncbi:MAG: EVE domain-containing protein [Candidatus Obscuribacterales bacterium]|nr:EVE domain-containing protein [Candidatus Obscuribacterales bacterium]
MSNWLVCLPREDMEHCVKVGVFGLKRKNVISQVQSGDRVACVVTREKEWKVIALGEAVSDYYLDDSSVFLQPGSFVDRFKFKAKKLKPEISFADLIPKMDFIKKPEYYSAYFKNGIVKLSEREWKAISDVAEQA